MTNICTPRTHAHTHTWQDRQERLDGEFHVKDKRWHFHSVQQRFEITLNKIVLHYMTGARWMNPCKKLLLARVNVRLSVWKRQNKDSCSQKVDHWRERERERKRENLVKFESACSHKKTEGPSTLSLRLASCPITQLTLFVCLKFSLGRASDVKKTQGTKAASTNLDLRDVSD